MPNWNFREPMVSLYNPCPPVAMKAIYAKIGHPFQHDERKCKLPAFLVSYRWSTGAEESTIDLTPYKHSRLPQSIALTLHRQVAEEGIVYITVDPEDAFNFKRELDIQGIKGLGKAHAFYVDRGHTSLHKYMWRRQIKSIDELGPRKSQVWGMLINAAKGDQIELEIERAQKRLGKLEAEAEKQRPAASTGTAG